jgi:putative ABC transport system permease protein
MQPFSAPVIIYARYSQAIGYMGGTRNQMSFVVAKAKDGQNPKIVAKRIEDKTGLKARSWDDFKYDTIKYYFEHTGIPINFGITVVLGFIIGSVICGQTFYIFVIENLRQFAALKAIGVTNKQILAMVLTQGLLVGIIGFSIGIGLTSIFMAKASVNVPAFKGFYLPWQVALGSFVAVFLIIIISSLASIRKVLVLDPAIVFRG